jgi:hypothetical protein
LCWSKQVNYKYQFPAPCPLHSCTKDKFDSVTSRHVAAVAAVVVIDFIFLLEAD